MEILQVEIFRSLSHQSPGFPAIGLICRSLLFRIFYRIGLFTRLAAIPMVIDLGGCRISLSQRSACFPNFETAILFLAVLSPSCSWDRVNIVWTGALGK